MTNEHAIDVIKHLKKYYNDKNEWEDGYIGFDNEDNEAIDLAIKALKQQPCEDCVNRSELQRTMDSLPLFRFVNNDHEEADDYYNCESVDMVIRNLPPVTPKYTDEEIDKAQAVEQAYVDKMVELAVKETERPKGKWVNKQFINSINGDIRDGWECSKCQSRFFRYDIPNTEDFIPKYCPNCGAEMGGGEDEVSD